MKTLSWIAVSIITIIASALWARDSSVYPGAKFDEKLTKPQEGSNSWTRDKEPRHL